MTRINSKIDETYTITHVFEVSSDLGVAVGWQNWSHGEKKYCNWEYVPSRDDQNYFSGHYMFETEADAVADALERAGLVKRDPDPDPSDDDDPDDVPLPPHDPEKIAHSLWRKYLDGEIDDIEWTEYQIELGLIDPSDMYDDTDRGYSNDPF